MKRKISPFASGTWWQHNLAVNLTPAIQIHSDMISLRWIKARLDIYFYDPIIQISDEETDLKITSLIHDFTERPNLPELKFMTCPNCHFGINKCICK